MEIVTFILLAILIVIVLLIGVDVAALRAAIISLKSRIEVMHELVAQLLATAAAQTTVVESFISFHVAATAKLAEAADSGDIDAVKSGIATLQANTAKLAAAMVTNTESSDEVPVEQGGTGDGTSAVDVAQAVTDAGGDPAAHGADASATAGAGSDAGAGSSSGSDAAAAGGTTGTVAGDGSGTVSTGTGDGSGDASGGAAGSSAGSAAGSGTSDAGDGNLGAGSDAGGTAGDGTGGSAGIQSGSGSDQGGGAAA